MIYLDHNATTPVAPEVLDAMLPFLRELWGNPSSAYWFGHQLSAELDEARTKVARLINAEPGEIVFTGCGTESINAALHSALVNQKQRRHLVATMVEHSATTKYCAFLERQGHKITYLPVSAEGTINLLELDGAIRPDTAAVSMIWGNNETGVLLPVKEAAEICRERKVLFHIDAVQVAGKLPVDVRELGADMLSLSAHKLYAPKGVGALYVKRGTRFSPYLIGGGQERGRRAGTENVAGAVAFGRAAALAAQNLPEMKRVCELRDRLERAILETISGTAVNGTRAARLPNTTNISFDGVEAEGLLMLLDQAGICASSGSACTTGSLEPSHVLVAMGCTAARARSSLRFSLGRQNTGAEIDFVLEQLPQIVERLRAASVV
jgi:cysteine desulfurase